METQILDVSKRVLSCPKHGEGKLTRHSFVWRKVFASKNGKPLILKILSSKFFCEDCNRFYNQNPDEVVEKGCQYSREIMTVGLQLLEESTLQQAQNRLLEDYGVRVPLTTLHDWRRSPAYADFRSKM